MTRLLRLTPICLLPLVAVAAMAGHPQENTKFPADRMAELQVMLSD
ncbi:MAG: hypothetical protein AAF919_12125 [Pseudomonadota bacterium]